MRAATIVFCSRAERRASTLRWGVLGGLLAVFAGVGCAPSKFDGLSGGHKGDDDDMSAFAGDAGMDAEEPEPDDELDADDPVGELSDASLMDAVVLSDATNAAADAADAGKDAAVHGDAEAGGPACTNSTSKRPLRVGTDATELARLRLPAGIRTRILGATVLLGTSRVWTFESNGLSTPDTRPAERPTNYPSSARDGSSTPWTKTSPTSDWQLSETLDARGMPESLLTLNAAEQAISDVTLFVSTLLRDPAQANSALGFARKAAGFFQPFSEIWFVRMSSAGSQATRGAAALFTAPEPLFGQAAVRDGNYFKLFACANAGPDAGVATAFPCKVARVPIARASERAAYEFYARDTFGAGEWTTDVTRAAPVVNATDYAVTVSFNEYLHQFLMVYGTPAGNSVSLRTAVAPEGPWSDALEVKQTAAPYWYNLNAREHESLAQNCGKRILISTWSPQDGESGFPTMGDVLLSAIDLQ